MPILFWILILDISHLNTTLSFLIAFQQFILMVNSPVIFDSLLRVSTCKYVIPTFINKSSGPTPPHLQLPPIPIIPILPTILNIPTALELSPISLIKDVTSLFYHPPSSLEGISLSPEGVSLFPKRYFTEFSSETSYLLHHQTNGVLLKIIILQIALSNSVSIITFFLIKTRLISSILLLLPPVLIKLP